MFCTFAVSANPFMPELQTSLPKTAAHAQQNFGSSVVVEGVYAAVGASQELLDPSASGPISVGAVHIYRREPDGWRWLQRLTPPDGAEDTAYGFSISLSEGTLAVGAYRDNTVSIQSGAVHVYTLQQGEFVFLQTLLPTPAGVRQSFGLPVAVSGSRMVVAAYGEEDLDPQDHPYAGSVYVFERDGNGFWVEQARLISPASDLGEAFAWWVDLDGSTVVVGAPYSSVWSPLGGAAYVFEGSGKDWVHTASLVSGQIDSPSLFGFSVSVDGNAIAVGAPSGGTLGGGAVDVFRRGAEGGWIHESFLEVDDSEGFEDFGQALTLKGDTLAVGAPMDSRTGESVVRAGGSVYVFEREPIGWRQSLELVPMIRSEWAQAGFSVAFDGRSLIMGAPGQLPAGCVENCSPEGAAEVYEQNRRPVADASATGTMFPLEEGSDRDVILDASASWDPDGDELAFEWWSGATLLGEGERLTVRLGVGLHALRLRVSDGRSEDSAPWTVEVVRPNQAPVARLAVAALKLHADASGGATVPLDGSGSFDPDGDALRYRWELGNQVLSEAVVAEVRLPVGSYVILLTVSDGQLTDSIGLPVEIEAAPAGNRLPVADASRTSKRVIASDGQRGRVRLDGTLSFDPDGDVLNHRWFDGIRFLGKGAVLEIELPVGEHGLRLEVSDRTATASTEVEVRVLSPSLAIELLRMQVEAADLRPSQKVWSNAILKTAQKAVERGNSRLGIHHLRLFQRLLGHPQVEASVADPLIAEAEAIVQAMEG